MQLLNDSQHWQQMGGAYNSIPCPPILVQVPAPLPVFHPLQQSPVQSYQSQLVCFEQGFVPPVPQHPANFFQVMSAQPVQVIAPPVMAPNVQFFGPAVTHLPPQPPQPALTLSRQLAELPHNSSPFSSPHSSPYSVRSFDFQNVLNANSRSSSPLSLGPDSSFSSESSGSQESQQFSESQDLPAVAQAEESNLQTQLQLFINLVQRCKHLQNDGRLSKTERSKLRQFLQKSVENRDFWKTQRTELFKTFVDLVKEMCDWLENELASNNGRFVNFCNKFMKMFDFLKEKSFNAKGFPFFEEKETPRAVVILARLLKQKQMFNFEGKCILTEERQDDPLRGRNVVRFRDKRLAVYSKRIYKFLEFLHNLFQNGVVDLKSMYTCRDHKTVKGKPGKSIQGLLWYIVFPDDANAEKFLKCCVRKCSGDSYFEEMFRKQASKEKNPRQDRQKRDALLNGKYRWTDEQFKMQQEMYHFGLALAGGEFKSKPEAHLDDHNLLINRHSTGC
jgi:hypothetical protein